MKRGAKELEKNDLIAAIAKYREAYERAPEDAEIAIALAEILSRCGLPAGTFNHKVTQALATLAAARNAPRSGDSHHRVRRRSEGEE